MKSAAGWLAGCVAGLRVLGTGLTACAQQGAAPAGFLYFAPTGHVNIVSSSHQDTAWMDTPGFCRNFRIEQNILPALDMMAKDPAYCFAMECTLHLMEFLEAHPERKADVVRLMKEGRLEFGATYNQPYESYLSGEELVRQAYYGRRWVRKNLPGCDARVAFNPDVPGRALQMQQILAKSGIPYLFTSRYHEGFYRWSSPDGSAVLAYTPGHYGNPMEILKRPPDKAAEGVRAKLEAVGGYYQARGIPPVFCLINSMDFSRPVDFKPLIDLWNAKAREGCVPRYPAMSYGSIEGFFKQVSVGQPRFDKLAGERPDVWLYIHGPTHHWTTSLRREAARLLPAAESFCTFDALLSGSFAAYPSKAFGQAWQDELYIDHGIGGKNGHITDEVFHRKVASARDTGRALLDKALRDIAARVKAATGRGAPVTVFNTLAWERTAPVDCEVPAGLDGALRVTDADGREVPCQLTSLGAPDEVNVAASSQGAQAAADSSRGPDCGPEKAIDGRWSVRDSHPEVGPAERWVSASGPGPHTLTIDFGQPRTIHRVVLRHEGVMGVFRDEAKSNTADFRLQGADAAAGPWFDLVPAVTGNVASLTSHAFAPRSMRFLRLFITKGSQQTGAAPASIYEVQAFAPVEAKPRRIVFVASDVPSMGYKTFYVRPAESAEKESAPAAGLAGAAAFENRFYRVALAPGGLRSIFDKAQRRELLATERFLGGEVFTMLSVAPDNRGKGTDAGEFGSVPMPCMDASFDRAALHAPAWRQVESGAVRTVFALEMPWKNTALRQRLTLWNDLKRIDFEVELAAYSGELWREFRMALPLALSAPALTYEVPMGVVQIGRDEIPTTGGHAYGNLTYFEKCAEIRPREVQNFIDASDALGGVTLSSDVSVFDWQDPTANGAAGVVLQPVLLATRKSCNGEGNWYPQAGDHRYRFSLTTHAGDWRSGWRAGVAANHPLEAVAGVPPAAGAALPQALSFCSVSGDNVTLTALKKGEDDDRVIVRCCDMQGQDSVQRLRLFLPAAWADAVDMIEGGGAPLRVAEGGFELPLAHHAIETAGVLVGAGPGPSRK